MIQSLGGWRMSGSLAKHAATLSQWNTKEEIGMIFQKPTGNSATYLRQEETIFLLFQVVNHLHHFHPSLSIGQTAIEIRALDLQGGVEFWKPFVKDAFHIVNVEEMGQPSRYGLKPKYCASSI